MLGHLVLWLLQHLVSGTVSLHDIWKSRHLAHVTSEQKLWPAQLIWSSLDFFFFESLLKVPVKGATEDQSLGWMKWNAQAWLYLQLRRTNHWCTERWLWLAVNLKRCSRPDRSDRTLWFISAEYHVTKTDKIHPSRLPEIRNGQELSCNDATGFRKGIQEETCYIKKSEQLIKRIKLTQRQMLHYHYQQRKNLR